MFNVTKFETFQPRQSYEVLTNVSSVVSDKTCALLCMDSKHAKAANAWIYQSKFCTCINIAAGYLCREEVGGRFTYDVMEDLGQHSITIKASEVPIKECRECLKLFL